MGLTRNPGSVLCHSPHRAPNPGSVDPTFPPTGGTESRLWVGCTHWEMVHGVGSLDTGFRSGGLEVLLGCRGRAPLH